MILGKSPEISINLCDDDNADKKEDERGSALEYWACLNQ